MQSDHVNTYKKYKLNYVIFYNKLADLIVEGRLLTRNVHKI